MRSVSTRQHLVPNFLDLSETELEGPPRRDLYWVLAVLVGLLFAAFVFLVTS